MFFEKGLLLLALAIVFVEAKDVSQVRFLLYYSKLFKELFIPLNANDSFGFQTTLYNSNKPNKFLCHGYTSHFFYKFPRLTKNAYLSLPTKYNVIVVNWDFYSGRDYATSASNVPDVGRAVANLINALIKAGRASLKDFHFIGHSIGSEVGAFISSNLGNGQIMQRVTGLDRARAGFDGPPDTRLDQSDATFVDLIHSSAGIGHSNATRPSKAVGTVDFYPNGGLYQRGCYNSRLVNNLCSHLRSYQYWTESIRTTKGFISYKCSSYEGYKGGNCRKTNSALMGEFVSQSINGTYYLDTASTSPYALG